MLNGWPNSPIKIQRKLSMAKLTKEEFKKEYCAKSGITWDELSKTQIVLPCSCNYEDCKGWAMVSNEPLNIKAHMDLYSGVSSS